MHLFGGMPRDRQLFTTIGETPSALASAAHEPHVSAALVSAARDLLVDSMTVIKRHV